MFLTFKDLVHDLFILTTGLGHFEPSDTTCLCKIPQSSNDLLSPFFPTSQVKMLHVHQIPKGIIVSSAAPRHHTGSAECLSA